MGLCREKGNPDQRSNGAHSLVMAAPIAHSPKLEGASVKPARTPGRSCVAVKYENIENEVLEGAGGR